MTSVGSCAGTGQRPFSPAGAVRGFLIGLVREPLERAGEASAELRERPAHPAVVFAYGLEEGPR